MPRTTEQTRAQQEKEHSKATPGFNPDLKSQRKWDNKKPPSFQDEWQNTKNVNTWEQLTIESQGAAEFFLANFQADKQTEEE